MQTNHIVYKSCQFWMKILAFKSEALVCQDSCFFDEASYYSLRNHIAAW